MVVVTSNDILQKDPQQPIILVAPLSTQMDHFDKFHDVILEPANHPNMERSRIVLSLIQPVRKDILSDQKGLLIQFEMLALHERMAHILLKIP